MDIETTRGNGNSSPEIDSRSRVVGLVPVVDGLDPYMDGLRAVVLARDGATVDSVEKFVTLVGVAREEPPNKTRENPSSVGVSFAIDKRESAGAKPRDADCLAAPKPASMSSLSPAASLLSGNS